jgi:hypothetical protein
MSAPKTLRVCHCRECGDYCEDNKNNCDALSRAMPPEICWARMNYEDRMAVDREIISRLATSASKTSWYRKKMQKRRER